MKYRQVLVLSGKGGTGKTTVAAALGDIVENKSIIDTDVDAANLHLLFTYQIISEYDYFGSWKAEINIYNCSQCGTCEYNCRFDAIKDFKVDPVNCEGCGFCFRSCPEGAISFHQTKTGNYLECEMENETKFYYAKLLPGEGNSGKLVNEIKQKAKEQIKENVKWIIIDGPPGIGCPVNASLSGVDFVIIVTEPTCSGLHDLKRLVDLLKMFRIPSGVIINKYDINPGMSGEIETFIESEKIRLLSKIPFSKIFIKSVQNSIPVTQYDVSFRKTFSMIWNDVQNILIS
jgi:MinD superfamily P-loop ATPase